MPLARVKPNKSPIGNENHIPFNPKNNGRIISAGIKNKVCLAQEIINAGFALPSDWYSPPIVI